MALKKAASIPLVIGELVHEVIAQVLRDRFEKGDIATPTYYHDRISTLSYSFVHRPYIDEPPKPEQLSTAALELVDAFLNSERLKWIRATTFQDFVIENPHFGETRINGWKAYVKVDFACKDAEGNVTVIDWKTGSSEYSNDHQLLTYTMWATDAFKVIPQQVSAIFAHLKGGYSETPKVFTFEDVLGAQQTLASQTQEMYYYLQSVPNNIPLPIEVFQLTDDKRKCFFCPYYKVCYADS